jgi:hypothetical protein
MFKMIVCLFFASGIFAMQGGLKVSYNSTSDQKNAIVRIITAYKGSSSVVKVSVNGSESVGQVGKPGLNTNSKDGDMEIIFVAAMLKAGANEIEIMDGGSSDKHFSWKDEAGKHKDLVYAGKNVFRYMYEKMNESDPKERARTYKPYHMVYDWAGKNFISKAEGGKFTHHRSIYYGFSRCSYKKADGSVGKADTWHCTGEAFQSHEGFILEEAGPVFARSRIKINWHGPGGVFANELRELTFYFVNGVKVVDFASSLSSELEYVKVDGDPQHAGFQYRASNEVAQKTAKETYYIRPIDGKGSKGKTKNWPKDKDMTNLLWKAQSNVVGGQRYTISYLDNPNNPKPSFFSERDYGRFGSYFKSKVTKDKPLNIRYRLEIQEGEVEAKDVEMKSAAFLDSVK